LVVTNWRILVQYMVPDSNLVDVGCYKSTTIKLY